MLPYFKNRPDDNGFELIENKGLPLATISVRNVAAS